MTDEERKAELLARVADHDLAFIKQTWGRLDNMVYNMALDECAALVREKWHSWPMEEIEAAIQALKK